ncbi:MAG: hypothetical protein LC725_10185 [Lentisphaerae bacterium]|nr:hypothetical protein [Lentisphaerota bacterium]
MEKLAGYSMQRHKDRGKPFDNARGKPFDNAQGKPFDNAQGKCTPAPFHTGWIHPKLTPL